MTNRMTSNVGSAFRALAVLGLLASGIACAGEEAIPPTGDEDTGDGDTGDGDGDPGDGDGDTGDGDGDPGDGDGDTGDECIGPDGCFACEPTNSIQITNACTDATCEAFENTQARLPLLERDGSLPPLP
jgi:hypothetical protein